MDNAPADYTDEFAQFRQLIEDRLNELDDGRVTPMDGEEAYRLLMERTDAQRRKRTA